MSGTVVEYLLVIFRWIHIFFGIIWIGHLYFFNFVNVPFQAVLAKELKPQVNPHLLHRALWWFRWGAMMTFIMGWLLFLFKYGHTQQLFTQLKVTGALPDNAIWILIGGVLGTIMWFNVWFVIWPAQRLILGWVKAGQAPPEMPALAKKALLFSRTNTWLSGPMLVGMIMPNNGGAFDFVKLLVFSAISLFFVYGMIKMSAKVGQPPA